MLYQKFIIFKKGEYMSDNSLLEITFISNIIGLIKIILDLENKKSIYLVIR
jgi:hypothetical protein